MPVKAQPLACEVVAPGEFRAVYPLMAARLYPPGSRVMFVPWVDRSEVSHRHEFAWIREAWLQLPEAIAAECSSPEHLRKRALIESGFFVESQVDAGTPEVAAQVAAFMASIDDFALIVTRGTIVVRRVAKSQAKGAMDPAEFENSKRAVLDTVSAWLGITPDELMRNAGRAA